MIEKQISLLIKNLYPIYEASTDDELKTKMDDILRQFCKEHEIDYPPLNKGERESICLIHLCPNCGSQEIHFLDYPDDNEVLVQCWDCEWESLETLSDMREAGYMVG